MTIEPAGPERIRTRIAALVARLVPRDYPLASRLFVATHHTQRYADFLAEILRRYEAACAEYRAVAPRLFSPEPLKALPSEEEERSGARLGRVVHLEIESFYLFAKILLDRVADLMADSFGLGLRDAGSSHADFAARFNGFCRTHRLEPGDLGALAKDLSTRVVRPRNKMIDHLTDPRRMRGITIDLESGRVGLTTGMQIMPEPGEPMTHHESEDLHKLFEDLVRYVLAALDFLEANEAANVRGAKDAP